MTNTVTATRPAPRFWARVALAVFAAVTIAVAALVTTRAFSDSGTDRQFPRVTTATHSGEAATPGNGLPCHIREAC